MFLGLQTVLRAMLTQTDAPAPPGGRSLVLTSSVAGSKPRDFQLDSGSSGMIIGINDIPPSATSSTTGILPRWA